MQGIPNQVGDDAGERVNDIERRKGMTLRRVRMTLTVVGFEK